MLRGVRPENSGKLFPARNLKIAANFWIIESREYRPSAFGCAAVIRTVAHKEHLAWQALPDRANPVHSFWRGLGQLHIRGGYDRIKIGGQAESVHYLSNANVGAICVYCLTQTALMRAFNKFAVSWHQVNARQYVSIIVDRFFDRRFNFRMQRLGNKPPYRILKRGLEGEYRLLVRNWRKSKLSQDEIVEMAIAISGINHHAVAIIDYAAKPIRKKPFHSPLQTSQTRSGL